MRVRKLLDDAGLAIILPLLGKVVFFMRDNKMSSGLISGGNPYYLLIEDPLTDVGLYQLPHDQNIFNSEEELIQYLKENTAYTPLKPYDRG